MVWKGIPCPRTDRQTDRLPPLPLVHHLPPSCPERLSKWISSPSGGIPAQFQLWLPVQPSRAWWQSRAHLGSVTAPGSPVQGRAEPQLLLAEMVPVPNLTPEPAQRAQQHLCAPSGLPKHHFSCHLLPMGLGHSFVLLLSLLSPSLQAKALSKAAGAHRQGQSCTGEHHGLAFPGITGTVWIQHQAKSLAAAQGQPGRSLKGSPGAKSPRQEGKLSPK